MIRRISENSTWHEGDKTGSGVYQRNGALDLDRLFELFAIFSTMHGKFRLAWLDAIKDILCLLQIVDFTAISPPVGCKDERSDVIEFTIRGWAVGIRRTVTLATPAEIALHRSILHLHIFLAPAPEAVEDVFSIKLHCNHHAVRHSLGAHIIILDI